MKRIIKRVKTELNQCIFQAEDDVNWKLLGVRTHGAKRGRYELYKQEELQYSMEQSSFLNHALYMIPAACLFVDDPFTFYKDGVRCGYSKRPRIKMLLRGIYDFYFEQQVYRVTIHSHGVHSLLKNGVQVAVYKRFGHGHYLVRCLGEIFNRTDLLILFAAFVELHVTLDTVAASNQEGTIVLGDKFMEYGRWRPDDELNEEPFLDKKGRANVFLSDETGIPIKRHYKD